MNVTRRRLAPAPIVIVLLCAGFSATCHAGGAWSGGLAATSDYVLRGISQSNEQPAVQGSLAYRWDAGWYAGVWASTLDHSESYYPAGTAEAEIDVFVGRRIEIDDDWSTTLQAVHYVYPGDGDVVDYDYSELEIAVSYRDIVRASVAWSPDASTVAQQQLTTDRDSTSYEVGLQYPLRPWLGIAAGLGYRALSGLEPDGHMYWSVGLAAQWRALSLNLARIGTDADGRALFGEKVAADRTVLSLDWSF